MKRIFNFTLVLLFALTLASCSESSRQENKLIQTYLFNVERVMQAHSVGIKNAKSASQMLQQQKTSLSNLQKVKKEFEPNSNLSELNALIDTVDFAISHLFIRNQQMYDLAEPLWKAQGDKYNKIRDPDYYRLHQNSLIELHAMMEEFKTLLKEHNANVRKKMLASGLSKEKRTQLWPSLNNLLAGYIATFTPQIYVVKQAVENETELAAFLFENREHYTFSEHEGLQFSDSSLAYRYNSMLRSMQFWQNQANDRMNMGF